MAYGTAPVLNEPWFFLRESTGKSGHGCCRACDVQYMPFQWGARGDRRIACSGTRAQSIPVFVVVSAVLSNVSIIDLPSQDLTAGICGCVSFATQAAVLEAVNPPPLWRMAQSR